MKVGVFLSGFTPEIGGGHTFQASVFQGFAGIIQETTHSFVVLCDSDAIAAFVSELGGLEVARVAPYAGIERFRTALRREYPFLRRFLRKKGRIERAAAAAGVQLVWYVGGGFYETMDIPYIATVWDLEHRTHPWLPEVSGEGIWYTLEEELRPFLQRASFVITGTEVGRKDLRDFYQISEDRIRKIPHPTPPFALEAARKDPGRHKDKFGLAFPFLLYPAQFWPHKNHANLLLALAHLRDSHGIRLSLALVGSDKGNLRYIRKLADNLQLHDQVSFLGFVAQNDLIYLYRQALALVYPSFCGPENLPPLEAFALGCPVVAADIPGAREQLGDAALLASPSDPQDFAEKIKEIVENKDQRSALVKKGQARAASWCVEDYARGVISLINDFEGVRRAWC